MENISHVGMDVHKQNIVVGECRKLGRSEIIGEYPNTDSGVRKMMKRFDKIKETHELKICYEAGPCGNTLKRILDKGRERNKMVI